MMSKYSFYTYNACKGIINGIMVACQTGELQVWGSNPVSDYNYSLEILKMPLMGSSGVRVGHSWATTQGTGYIGALAH